MSIDNVLRLFLIHEFPTNIIFLSLRNVFMLEKKAHSFKNGWKISDMIKGISNWKDAVSWPMSMWAQHIT